MSSKKTKTILLGGVAASAALLVGGLVGVAPQLSDASEATTQTQAINDGIVKMDATLVDLRAKQDRIAPAIDELAAIEAQFPTDFAQDTWIEMLQATAKRTGVTISGVTLGVPADATVDTPDASGTVADDSAPAAEYEYDSTDSLSYDGEATPEATGEFGSPVARSTVSLSARGPVANLRKFLTALSDLERPLFVEKVGLAGDGDGSLIVIDGATYMSQELPAPDEAPVAPTE